MDAAAHYRQLAQLGRDEFLAAAAPAALLRIWPEAARARYGGAEATLTLDDDSDAAAADLGATLPRSLEPGAAIEVEIYPLLKKPGASFPDRITIGRTANNDVVIADGSVSRLHAYVRRAGNGGLVADAGSKNGSWLSGSQLEARRERPLISRAVLRIGDVDVTFLVAADLYRELGGAP